MKRMTIPEIRHHPRFQARLPRYLAVPPPDTMQQAKKIDEEILQEVIKMGFVRNRLVESLRNRLQNEGTVAYYFLLDNRFPVSNGYPGAEFQETMLYKTRKEKYLLDLQKLHGPQFLFLDLCVAPPALVVMTRRAFSETRTKGRVGE